MSEVILIGYGGHARVISDIAFARGDNILGFLDDKYDTATSEGSRFLAPLSSIETWLEKYPDAKLVICIGDNGTRETIAQSLPPDQERFISLIHPTACIGSHVAMGHGTVVMPYVVINSGASIGNHCIINSGAVIEHDVIIGDFSHIASKAALAGNVHVGQGVLLGIGSSVIPGIRIGDGTTIGAGAVVVKDLPSLSRVVGVPARPIM